MNYTPPPTIDKFMRSTALVRCCVGPLGSGKTMGALMEIFRRSCQQAPEANGIRPSRWALVRNTAGQLRDTTLSDIKQYFPFAVHKVGDQQVQLRLPLTDGTTVHSDWLMVPLERPEDQRKLLSLNLTGAFIEECREVPFDVVSAMLGRVGRYPSKARVEPTWQGIIMVTNPWSEGSQYHEAFVIDPRPGWELFVQPGGLEPNAENVENLPADYYERLATDRSTEWVNVHVHGMWGEDQFGQAVYRFSFDRGVHCADHLMANPGIPLLAGIDFGRTPTVVVGQEDPWGRLVVLRELKSEDLGLHAFCQTMLLPLIHQEFPLHRLFIIGDPAGRAKSQYTEETAYDVLKHYGLDAIPAPTNDIAPRIRAVEKRLLDMRGNKTALLIDEDQCPSLVRGFMRDYRYRKKRDGELEPTPEKNEASHIHDAMQYLALGAQSNYVGRRVLQKVTRPPAVAPRFSAKAWT